jgi:hypothetical protein
VRSQPIVLLVAAAISAPGCVGEDAREEARGEPFARRPPAGDHRAPDRVGRLTGVEEGGTFACRTDGRLAIRFAGVDGLTLSARGRPLAYGRLDTRLVRRDCRRVATAPHPFSRLTATRWTGPRLSVTTRPDVLRCRVPPVVEIDLRSIRSGEPGMIGGPADEGTQVFVIASRTGRLVALAVLERLDSRLLSTPSCRRLR